MSAEPRGPSVLFLQRREPVTLKTARMVKTTVETQIAQAEFIGWPELAESFRGDLQRVESLMAQRGWL